MGEEYTIKAVEQRDEWGPIHGSMMQDYAIALQGENGWIKLTQKVSTPPPRIEDKLFGLIETKQNTNGNSYKKFKKINPEYRGDRNTDAGRSGGGQASSDSKQRLEYAIQMLEELTGRRDVVHDIPDGDVKLPTLDVEQGPVPEPPPEDPFEGLV